MYLCVCADLRRMPSSACFLGLRVRVPLGTWMSVCCECFVCVKVEVFATGRSLFERSPTECGVSVVSMPQHWGSLGARGKYRCVCVCGYVYGMCSPLYAVYNVRILYIIIIRVYTLRSDWHKMWLVPDLQRSNYCLSRGLLYGKFVWYRLFFGHHFISNCWLSNDI